MNEKAVISHGRNGWKLEVQAVSAWRVWLSDTLLAAMHTLSVCCGIRLFAWAQRSPDWVAFPFYRITSWLVNWAGRIDNGWLHIRYAFPLDDAFVRKHYPDFWEDMAFLMAEDDPEPEPSGEVIAS